MFGHLFNTVIPPCDGFQQLEEAATQMSNHWKCCDKCVAGEVLKHGSEMICWQRLNRVVPVVLWRVEA